MELKFAKVAACDVVYIVLIVPLWNWNDDAAGAMSIVSAVLIVPLWNWNALCRKERLRDKCFNCTFMELKSTK